MIEIDDLHLRIDGKAILTGISTRLPAQGLIVVIGPNGAGKSSLLSCLAGLTRPTQGAVRIDGYDVARLAAKDRARRLALLPQDSPGLPRLSVRDLVGFGRWPHHRGRPSAKDRRIVAEALAAFDLDALAERRLDTLSGGQRQRAFVAMAHAQATPWMLLDEPLAALDPRHAHDIMARLRALSRPGAGGRGIVVVLHDLAMAARHADWAVCLRDGRLIRSAPAAEALTDATLSDLFDTTVRVRTLEGQKVVLIGGNVVGETTGEPAASRAC